MARRVARVLAQAFAAVAFAYSLVDDPAVAFLGPEMYPGELRWWGVLFRCACLAAFYELRVLWPAAVHLAAYWALYARAGTAPSVLAALPFLAAGLFDAAAQRRLLRAWPLARPGTRRYLADHEESVFELLWRLFGPAKRESAQSKAASTTPAPTASRLRGFGEPRSAGPASSAAGKARVRSKSPGTALRKEEPAASASASASSRAAKTPLSRLIGETLPPRYNVDAQSFTPEDRSRKPAVKSTQRPTGKSRMRSSSPPRARDYEAEESDEEMNVDEEETIVERRPAPRATSSRYKADASQRVDVTPNQRSAARRRTEQTTTRADSAAKSAAAASPLALAKEEERRKLQARMDEKVRAMSTK